MAIFFKRSGDHLDGLAGIYVDDTLFADTADIRQPLLKTNEKLNCRIILGHKITFSGIERSKDGAIITLRQSKQADG